jgi:non-ribosomal peptide synthetase component F
VFVTERESGIQAMWLYNPDLFGASTIDRMTALYEMALEFVAANPTARLSGILKALADAEDAQRATEQKEYEQVSLQALKSIRRRREAKP